MKLKTDFLLPAAMLVFSGSSHALEWLFEPDFRANERYDDNITMQVNSNSMVDSMITTLSPGLLFGYLADNNELRTRFKWNEQIYHSASDLDFSEKLLDLSHQFQAEHFRTTLQANYAEESSINTQLEEAGSGNLQKLVPRTTKSISPGITFNLNETNLLDFNFNYQDVAFERGENVGNSYYSDYNNKQVSSTFTHLFSERLSAFVTGSYSWFVSPSSTNGISAIKEIQVPGIGTFKASELKDYIEFFRPGTYVGSNLYGPATIDSEQSQTALFYQIGLQYAFDEMTQASIAFGARDIQTEYSSTTTFSDAIIDGRTGQPITFSDLLELELPAGTRALSANDSQTGTAGGNIYSASVNRNFERGTLNLSALQQLNPSSTGSQQQTTQFSLRGRYDFNERWSAGLDARYLISDSVSSFGGNTLNNNRTYTNITPNVQWRWTREMSLQLSYSFRQQIYESSDQTAIGNSIQLQFSYQPQINRQVK